MIDLKGKVALVTGGSRGLGRADCLALARAGADVVVTDILIESDPELEKTAEASQSVLSQAMASQKAVYSEKTSSEIRDMGRRSVALKMDVTNREQVKTVVDQVVNEFGSLDILVNNSGIISDRTIKKMSVDNFESVVRVNLTGTFTVTQKAAVILRNGGRIINMSSVSGQLGLFGQANYASSKAAIIALTKVSAREFARQNITVNAIAPGFIDVGMSKGMPDEVTQNFIKQIPLGRLGDVGEIVNGALFLASSMASYITGHVLNVNGGFYMG